MKTLILLLSTALFILQVHATARLTQPREISETYPKPCYLEGEDIGHAAELTWQAPGTCEPDSLPVETAGFRIYRDEVMIAETDGETFWFLDDNGSYLPTGSYSYTITALYIVDDDLVESEHEGPVVVVIAPGFGFISGIIWDCISLQPIAGATITTGDFSTTSLSNGTFTILLFEFDTLEVHVSAPGYCDSTFLVIWGSWFGFNFCLMPCDITGSIHTAEKPDEIMIYPVPASEMLNVRISKGIHRIRMYSYTGQVVLDRAVAGEQTMHIDVKTYHTGAYILQLVTEDGRTLNKRIIINR